MPATYTGYLPNQGNGLCLTDIREKSGNLTSAKDNQGNISGNVCLCLFDQSKFQYMLEKACKKADYAFNKIFRFHFPL